MRPCIALLAASPDRCTSAAADEREKYWPQWRGPYATGVSKLANPPTRMERDEEHQVESRDSRPRVVVAGRLGRSHLSADGGACRRRRRRVAQAPRRHQPARAARVQAARARSHDGQGRVGEDRARAGAARTGALRQRHVVVGVRDHRRPARHRLLRVVRHLLLRHERHAGLGEGSRRQEDAQRVRRGIDAGASRQHARRSSGIISAASRSSSRSTSAAARNCGASTATRSTRGRRRSSSRTTGRAQVDRAGDEQGCAATICRPAPSCGKRPASP